MLFGEGDLIEPGVELVVKWPRSMLIVASDERSELWRAALLLQKVRPATAALADSKVSENQMIYWVPGPIGSSRLRRPDE